MDFPRGFLEIEKVEAGASVVKPWYIYALTCITMNKYSAQALLVCCLLCLLTGTVWGRVETQLEAAGLCKIQTLNSVQVCGARSVNNT